MENLIVFILNVLIQTIMYGYFIFCSAKVLTSLNFNKSQKILLLIGIFVAGSISQFLKKMVPGTNMLIYLLCLFIAIISTLRTNAFKTVLIVIITAVYFAIIELITIFIGKIFLKINISSLTTQTSFILVTIQLFLSLIVTKILFAFLEKRYQNWESLKNINSKQIIAFIISLIICVFPQMILFVINDYSYSPTLLIINCIQFIIVCIFIFSYLKKSIEHEKVQSDLFTSELHNKTLVGMVDGVRTLKHDYNNIMQALNGYVSTKQYDKLQEHINQVLKECNVVNNLSVIDPKIFNDPAIYGIVGSKFFIANKEDITFEFDVTTNIAQIQFPMPNLSRILGILLDNAIEATRKANSKYVRLEFKYDKRKCADIIKVINTYDTNININLNEIYNKGFSTKEVKSGIGLWEVKKLVNKNKNSQIYATIENNKFVQNLIIEKVD